MAKKKMKSFTSLFFNHKQRRRYSCPWPSCTHSRTDSFRTPPPTNMYKTINSVHFRMSESWYFTNSSESASNSTESGGESTEIAIRGLRSERFFFEPSGETRSIVEEVKVGGLVVKEGMVLAMESEDPYLDFRVSMEEMVESHGLKDWECLGELLLWYLRMNEKKTHGFIVGAFVDLLVGLLSTSSFVEC